MNKKVIDKCSACGKCCSYEIPITILDIHRISKSLNLSDENTFKKIIQKDFSEKSGLFKIAKKKNRECVFLNKNNLCDIHDNKPRVCDFYFCGNKNNEDKMEWTSQCIDYEDKIKLWEQSVASRLTLKYIEKNGSEWNETDFLHSLTSIYDNILIDKNQKLKLAKTEDKQAIGLKYNCETCNKRGECATETIVTIIDIKKIVEFKDISWGKFFKDFLEKKLSKKSGTYKLKRNNHCVFFDEEKHCLLGDNKPNHCNLTPCPGKVKDPGIYNCFYLGAGTVEEQFKHQVAIALTKNYIIKNGFGYNKKEIEGVINQWNNLVTNKQQFKDFCRQIANYRYVDDTKYYLTNN